VDRSSDFCGEKIMTKDDVICFFILMLFTLGWFDWLWIFGVESSRSWTWWALVAHFGAN